MFEKEETNYHDIRHITVEIDKTNEINRQDTIKKECKTYMYDLLNLFIPLTLVVIIMVILYMLLVNPYPI